MRSKLRPRHALVLASMTSCLYVAAALGQDAPNEASSTTEPVLSDVCLQGTGSRGWCGDAGPGSKAKLASPRDVALIGRKAYLIADFQNNVVRRVSSKGIVTTVAGIGVSGHDGDGGPATAARLDGPAGVSRYPRGGFLVSEAAGNTIRRVKPDGTIVTIAGTGTAGSGGDDGPAVKAQLRNPRNLVALADGSYLIADTGNDRIRLVDADGTIATVAGGNGPGYTGDGGPAVGARLNGPTGIAPLPAGGFLIADRGNAVVRRVAADGTIATVAGGSMPAGAGPATQVRLRLPTGVAALDDGGFLVADAGRVRRVHPDGRTITVAGTGHVGFSRDSGLATRVKLAYIASVAPTPDGAFLFVDEANDRVRRVSPSGMIRTKVGSGTPAPPQEQDSAPPAPLPPPPLPGAQAAAALLGARKARCDTRQYIPTFQTLNLLPLGGSAVVVRLHHKIRIKYQSYVPARPKDQATPPTVRVKVMLGSRVQAARRGRPRNGTHRVVLSTRLARHRRYMLVVDGAHVQGGHLAKRCDARPLRVK